MILKLKFVDKEKDNHDEKNLKRISNKTSVKNYYDDKEYQIDYTLKIKKQLLDNN